MGLFDGMKAAKLLKQLRCRDLAKYQVIQRLGTLGKHAVPVFAKALSDTEYEVRDVAAKGLVSIGKEAVGALVEVLDGDDAVALSFAAEALGDIGDEAAVPSLIEKLEYDEFGVRERAAEALGKIADPRAVEPLAQAVSDFPENRAEYKAIRALGNIGEAAKETLVELLGLSSLTEEYRRYVAEELRGVGFVATDEGAAIELMLLNKDWDGLVSEGTKAVPAMLVALDTSDVKWELASALSRIGEPAIPFLLEAMSNEDEDTLSYVVRALGETKHPKAFEPLLLVFEKHEGLVRQVAATQLGILGDPRAVEPLLRELGSAKMGDREEIACALGTLGDPRAVQPLIGALQDSGADMAATVATQLGKIGDPSAIEALQKATKHKEWTVRLRAVRALGDIGYSQAVEAVTKRLFDNDPDVTREAIESLGKIGAPDPQAVHILTIWLNRKPVQDAAERALTKMVGRSPVNPFRLPEGTIYQFPDPKVDSTHLFKIVEAVVAKLPGVGLQTAHLEGEGQSVVTVFGPTGSMLKYKEAFSDNAEQLYAATGLPVDLIRPTAMLTNIADPGNYIADASGYLRHLKKLQSGELTIRRLRSLPG